MIFHHKKASNLVAEHYVRDFYMICASVKEAQTFISGHYEIDFEIIFNFKLAQNLLQSTNERYFDLFFHFKAFFYLWKSRP